MYEKQRVNDEYLEKRKEQLNYLIGYYENRFKYTQHNKYIYQVYVNNYKMFPITKVLTKRLVFTTFMTGILGLINPLTLFLLIPEYYSLIFSFKLLRGQVENITLSENKQSINIHTYNFLGINK